MGMGENMQAAVFEKTGVLKIKTVPKPKIKKPDDVLVMVEACSICGSDTRGLANPPEFIFPENIIIGHELVGVVEGIGDKVTTVKPGDRVVLHPNLWCENCIYCREGLINLCENIKNLGCNVDGGMSEYICAPEKLFYKISKDIPSHVASLVEPLACVLNGTESVKAHPGQTVVVLGAGSIGLLYMMIYKAAGAKVIMTDINAKRLKNALELGADIVVNSTEEDLFDIVIENTNVGADIVVDAVGILLDKAIAITRKGGSIVLFGLNEKVKTELKQIAITFNELKIRGTYIANGTFPLAVYLVENKVLPLEKLITHRLPLKDAKKGIDLMAKGKAIKVVIEM